MGTGKYEMEAEIELTVRVPVKFTVQALSKDEALQKVIEGKVDSCPNFYKAKYEIDHTKIDFTALKTFDWERKGMKLKSAYYSPDRGWLNTYTDKQGIEHTINDCSGQNITEFIINGQFKEPKEGR